MIWNQPPCPFLKKATNMGLDECKTFCENTSGCTAINFNSGQRKCVLRECAIPVPPPAWNYGRGYKGYYTTQGTIKEYTKY